LNKTLLMKIPKIIERFIFESITATFVYKGHKMFSATYVNPENGVKMKLFTSYDEQINSQTFGISVNKSIISGIPTFEKLIEIAFELVKENKSFLGTNQIDSI